MAVHDDAHDLVAEREGVGLADDAAGLGREVVDVHDLQAGGREALGDLRAARVHRDAVLGDDHVHARTGRDERRHLRHDARDAAAEERAHDDREGAVLGGVGMAAHSAADNAVGAHEDIDIEVHVHFEGGEDHDVQRVHGGADVVGARVLDGGDLLVGLVLGDGFGRDLVEGLPRGVSPYGR